MEKGFTIKGYWWLPSQPEKRIAGELNYTPGESLILEIQGSFCDEDVLIDLDTFVNQQMILGIGNNGKAITLIDCIMVQKGSSISYDGSQTQTQRLLAQQCFEGFHYLSGEAEGSRVIVEFTNLDEWTGFQPLKATQTTTETIEFRYDRPKAIRCEIEGFTLVMGGNYALKSSINETCFYTSTYIEIASKNICTMNQFRQVIREFQFFLSFAVGQPVYPKSIKLITSEDAEVASIAAPFNFYYIPARYHAGDPPVPFYEMLFCLPDIEDNYSAIIAKWHDLSEKLKPVFDVFFSMMFEREAYSENKFLRIIQALEAYHRRIFGGKFLPDEDYMGGLYKEFVAVIPEGLEKEFETSLRDGKLKYANEYSLRKRLGEMADIVGGEIPFIFLSTNKGLKDFIKKVINSRNQLTHYPEEPLTPIRGQELYELTTNLTALFSALLLHDCGFSWEMVRHFFERNRKLKQLLPDASSPPLAQ